MKTIAAGGTMRLMPDGGITAQHIPARSLLQLWSQYAIPRLYQNVTINLTRFAMKGQLEAIDQECLKHLEALIARGSRNNSA